MKPCTECPRYSTCIKICDEVEKHLSTVTSSKRELTFTEHRLNVETIQDNYFWEDRSELTIKQDRIMTLFNAGMNSTQIARYINIDDSYIRREIRKFK